MSHISCKYRLHIAHGVSRWLLYPILYHVIRYRKKVVRENLQIAFPKKSAKERLHIERAFYAAFADMIMEIIVGRRFSPEEMQELVLVHHKEEVITRCRQYGGGFLMLGHFLNWEWAANCASQIAQYNIECDCIYKQLSNKFFNKLMLNIRNQRGATLVEMDHLLRTLIGNRNSNHTVIYAMLADQRPRKQSAKIPMVFMGQEVNMLLGTEQLATKFAYPVYYASMLSPARGHYEVDFHLIYDPDTEPDLPKGEITKRFAEQLENNILQNPSRWLWSHRRFLHTKPHTTSSGEEKAPPTQGYNILSSERERQVLWALY
ncbi:MAG TPA: hypothetical protein DIW30_07175, partial [Bacteroidales bacterium]|nr:hypothetical protein [Bacteroidales bacterium]